MTKNNQTPADEQGHAQEPSDGIDVAHLAGLARLAIDADKTQAVSKDLQSIIGLIDVMQSVNTEGVEPLSHAFDGTARLRADDVTEHPDPEQFQRNAPATADHYYLVPRVVE
jgi:aspartyl-tRNA(Asn)/glutamyl-tRNA(Gln) amidotransferase subunit C